MSMDLDLLTLDTALTPVLHIFVNAWPDESLSDESFGSQDTWM